MPVLPVNYPPITSYTQSTALLSILSTTDAYIPWFLSNFVQLYSDQHVLDFYNFTGRYLYCPWIESQVIHRQQFAMLGGDLHAFIRQCIDQGKYVIAVVDKYYISNFKDDTPRHAAHPMFIYGYDATDRTYHAGEFFRFGRYQFEAVGFDELHEAYEKCDDSGAWVKGISVYTCAEHRYPYAFDIDFFRRNLSGYLHSSCPSLGYRIEPIHYEHVGLTAVQHKVEQQLASMRGSRRFDRRVFALLHHHKKVLRMAWSYMVQRELLADDEAMAGRIQELEQRYLLLQNLTLKYMITLDNALITRVERHFFDLLQVEKGTIGELLAKLEQAG